MIVSRLILVAALLPVSALAFPSGQQEPGGSPIAENDQLATEAYRTGDHVTAAGYWSL